MKLTLAQLKKAVELMENHVENDLAKSPVNATFDLWDGCVLVQLEQPYYEGGEFFCNVYYRYNLEDFCFMGLEVDSYDFGS